MSNTITQRQEHPNESRQDTVERLRREVYGIRHPKIEGETHIDVPFEGKSIHFTFAGHATQCYMEEAIKQTLQLQDQLRAEHAARQPHRTH